MEQRKRFVVGIDTGGTFTDITVLAEDGTTYIDKAATTPLDFSEGVMKAIDQAANFVVEAIEVAAGDAGLTTRQFLQQIQVVKHGTTVGTNALITRSGARVGFITTRGFEDTTLIMRAIGRVDGLSEDEIKHVAYVTKPEPLVPKARLKGVSERVDFQGKVVVPMNETEAREAIRSLVEEHQVEAIAVSFLFGWVNPVHERRMRELIQEMYPRHSLFLTFAHELVPVVREYGRANTVILNCFLGKTMREYVGNLEQKLRAGGYTGPLLIMQANGGIVHSDEMTAIGTVSSGPAGGVIATKYFADLLGHPNVISTDMGGTSFDVALLTDGFWHYAREPIISRFRVIQPMIDVESIGAGGGTIARVEPDTKRLLVGPQSAGAWPGPVCYEQGGAEPTVTDADLVLGIIDPDYFLGGRFRLNKKKAAETIRRKIAEPLGMSVSEAAAGIYDVISSHMSDLIRKQVVRTGHVPEEYVIYAFGGAGPVHCAAYAAELGANQVYVFPTSAVFSSFGIAAADIIHSYVSSYRYFMPVDPAVLNERLAAIEERLLQEMGREGIQPEDVAFRRTFYMRYRRQMNELGVVVPTKVYDEAGIREVMEIFERKYEEVFGAGSGYSEAGIELISVNVDAVARTPKPLLPLAPLGGASAGDALKGYRDVFFTGGTHALLRTAIYEYGRLRPGNVVEGPAIVETPITTVVIPPGKVGRLDDHRNLVLEL